MQHRISFSPGDGFSLLSVKMGWFVPHCDGNSRAVLQQPSKPKSRAGNFPLTFPKQLAVFSLLNDAMDRSPETILPVSSRDGQLITSDYRFFSQPIIARQLSLGKGEQGSSMHGCAEGDCQPLAVLNCPTSPVNFSYQSSIFWYAVITLPPQFSSLSFVASIECQALCVTVQKDLRNPLKASTKRAIFQTNVQWRNWSPLMINSSNYSSSQVPGFAVG